ncbi:MAG: hypothetical protein ACP5IB_06195 [Thermoplasmata archaeon]
MESETMINKLSMPLPLFQLRYQAKKNHKQVTIIIDRLINDYIKENSNKFEAVYDIILKLMEYNINLEDPDIKIIEKFKNDLEDLDHRFRYINQFMNDLPISEQRNVWLKYFNQSISLHQKIMQMTVDEIMKKDDWSQTDALFKGYYELYISLIKQIYSELILEKDEEKTLALINLASIALLFYSSIIYGYFKNKLNKEIMITRMAELIAFVKPLKTLNYDKKTKDILEKISLIPPVRS